MLFGMHDSERETQRWRQTAEQCLDGFRTSGRAVGETMTGAQISTLQTLSEEAGEAFDASLSKGEAAKRIDELHSRRGRGRDQ